MKRLEIPKIVTSEVPGPKAKKFLSQHRQNVPESVSNVLPTFIKRAEGALFEDVDGNVFLDFGGGIGVLNIGYSHPEIVEAVKEQADKYFHAMINNVFYETYFQLAEKMNEIMPGDHAKKTFFVNSGAEAVENAIKIARKYTKRTEIITFTGAFHGRTLLTMSLTSKVKPYKYGFGPFAPGIHRMEFPYCYRCPFGLKRETCGLHCAGRFEDFFLEEVDPSEVAAIIIEPIQGEGGFVVPPDEYVVKLREICDEHGILLIADEIQSGFSRSGKMFAHEYWGVLPDLVTTAKSIAAGLPIAAVTGKAEIMDSPQPGGIGGTYCGNPLSTVAGLKTIEIMKRDNFPNKAMHVGQIMMDRLKKMQDKFAMIGDVRGRGAMLAMEIVKDRESKKPAVEETISIQKECWKNGLLVLNAGVRGNSLRFLMPLVISDDQLSKGFDILEQSAEKFLK
jgi:4-aminobutyrate aminotransferase/(S)-3-amino-2-methylpropionate transaminase